MRKTIQKVEIDIEKENPIQILETIKLTSHNYISYEDEKFIKEEILKSAQFEKGKVYTALFLITIGFETSLETTPLSFKPNSFIHKVELLDIYGVSKEFIKLIDSL